MTNKDDRLTSILNIFANEIEQSCMQKESKEERNCIIKNKVSEIRKWACDRVITQIESMLKEDIQTDICNDGFLIPCCWGQLKKVISVAFSQEGKEVGNV